MAKKRKKITKKFVKSILKGKVTLGVSSRGYEITKNPLKRIRIAESKIQGREITQKEASIRYGVSLSVYQAYERETNPHAIPEYIVRSTELGALRAVGLLDENGKLRKSLLQLEINIWNRSIRGRSGKTPR